MPVLLDLDNTLVDRDGAFARWAHDSVNAWDGDAADTDWLARVDANDYTPCDQLATMIIERLNPRVCGLESLVAQLLYENVEMSSATREFWPNWTRSQLQAFPWWS